ncbi:MAG: NAD(P)H-hydrate dehydratase [Rhizobacter sp.]
MRRTAARLLGSDAAQVQADRLAAAQAIADDFGCVVLLKGSGTIVAAPQRAPHINGTGSGALASAGTGDVLAGWLGGRWAQRSASLDAQAVQQLAAAAAHAHGAAADRAAATVMRAGDLIEALAAGG